MIDVATNFKRESEMASAVRRWIVESGMLVAQEVTTPWGVCDFVGVRFNISRANYRLKLKQKRPLNSIRRASLLLHIPDVESNCSTSVRELAKTFAPLAANTIETEIDRLSKDRYIIRGSRDRLQKLNGWMPIHDRMITVELKLSRVSEAINQAISNLGLTNESYVALPFEKANRIAENMNRRQNFSTSGVGLLGVTSHDCHQMIPAGLTDSWIDPVLQMHTAEKFWRGFVKDIEA